MSAVGAVVPSGLIGSVHASVPPANLLCSPQSSQPRSQRHPRRVPLPNLPQNRPAQRSWGFGDSPDMGFGACFMLPSPVIVEAEASAECASAPMATPAAAPTMTMAVWLAVGLLHDGAIAAARRGVQYHGGGGGGGGGLWLEAHQARPAPRNGPRRCAAWCGTSEAKAPRPSFGWACSLPTGAPPPSGSRPQAEWRGTVVVSENFLNLTNSSQSAQEPRDP